MQHFLISPPYKKMISLTSGVSLVLEGPRQDEGGPGLAGADGGLDLVWIKKVNLFYIPNW